MKSQAICRNKNKKRKRGNGAFLVMEALIALALMATLVPTALALSWSNGKLLTSTKSELTSLANKNDFLQNSATNQVASSTLAYQHEFGRNNCSLVPKDPKKGFVGADIYNSGNLNLGTNAVATALAAHDGYVYETAEPSSRTLPDFFVIDDRDVAVPVVVSSLVTGPGLAGIAVSGYYAYVANESSVSQLRIIDIHDRSHPTIIVSLKLPFPNASATAPLASSLFYDAGSIYLGTQKWEGNEFNVIDVSNPLSPTYQSGFDTDSLVNSIYENGGYAYVALPATNDQLDIVDVHNASALRDLSHVAPAGSAVLEGKAFAYDSSSAFDTASATGTLYFGRAGGGFDNASQYELFSFDLSRDPYVQNQAHSLNIPGGVYGIAYSDGYIFLATGDPTAGFQIWKSDFSKEVYSAQLPGKPVSLVCDGNRLYAAISTPAGFAAIVPY